MKKILIILSGLSMLYLSACSSDYSSMLLGKWHDSGQGIFEFLNDHRIVVFSINPKDQTLTEDFYGKWDMSGDGRIKMELNPSGARIVNTAYFQDNDHIIMEMKDQKYLLTRWKQN